MKNFRKTTSFAVLTAIALFLTGCLGFGGSVEDRQLTAEQKLEIEAMVSELAAALADEEVTTGQLEVFFAADVELLGTSELMEELFDFYLTEYIDVLLDRLEQTDMEELYEEQLAAWDTFVSIATDDEEIDAAEWLAEFFADMEMDDDTAQELVEIYAPIFEAHRQPEDRDSYLNALLENDVAHAKSVTAFMEELRWILRDDHLSWDGEGSNLIFAKESLIGLLFDVEFRINVENEQNDFDRTTILEATVFGEVIADFVLTIEEENGNWVITGVSSVVTPGLDEEIEDIKETFLSWLEEE